MTDLTPILSELLKSHDARLAQPSLTLQNIDEFLKEAYQINSHIASLNSYLRAIRQPYLSTAAPPRRNRISSQDSKFKYLTDREREEIDAATKKTLRELNAGIRNLADAEQLRQNTRTTLTRKKYARLGLGALGSWAAGGAGQTKSFEQEQEEAKALAISTHRESVLWYLRRKLQECGSIQASMMEKRIRREMEKNRSVLEKSEWGPVHEYGGYDNAPGPSIYKSTAPVHMEAPQFVPEDELTPEQIQVFEKQNQDMLKQYESTLNQVSKAEKSLLEISELQTQLVNNLAIQSAHIDQLVADSFYTAENVGGGNQQLKKATERQSTAKYVFYASCGLSLFLVVWDLII
ncbi:Syntaxin-18 [Hyphodiscus hymeniophilus]|uniref:Syntaxin-18 n=1 Tax=Hyphodiscus hymeniophilus TaxID=353542 RepID=A0A9P6VSM9_9HELO|nr:Syntaxin-18 [Hyphodiscus hymeniophilus]